MDVERFFQQLDLLHSRLTTLYQYASELPQPQSKLLLAAFEELHTVSAELQLSFEEFYIALEQKSALEDELFITREELQAVEREVYQQNTELVSAYHEVKKAYQSYLSLRDLVPDGYLVTDFNGIVREANRAAATLLHVSQQFLVGQPLSIFLSEEKHQVIQAKLSRLNQPEQIQDLVVRLRPAGGEPFDAALSVTTVCAGEGESIAVRWLIRNTNERRKMELALQESHNFLQAIVEATTEPIFVKDLQGRYLVANSTVARIFGKSLKEIIGKDDTQLVSTEQARQVRETDCRILTTQATELVEESLTVAGVVRTYLSMKGPCWDSRGNVIGLIGIMRDLTERKQVEESLRQQSERERLVAKLAQRIRSCFNLEEIFSTTVAEVRQFLQSDRVLIYRFLTDWSGVVVAESLASGCLAILGTKISDSFFAEITGRKLYKQGRIQTTDNIYTAGLSECHVNLLEKLQVRANLVVPILQGEQLWGLLVANHCFAPRHWQPLEIDLLKQVATQVALALQQNQLYEQIQSQLDTERAFNWVIQSIRNSLDLTTIFATAVAEIAQLLQADRAQIVQYLPQQQLWLNVADYRQNLDLPNALGLEIPDRGNEIAAALKRLEVVQIDDASTCTDEINRGFAQTFPGAWLLVPLHFGCSIWGSLGLVKNKQPMSWQEREVKLTRALADQLAIAIQQSTLLEQVQIELAERQQAEKGLRARARQQAAVAKLGQLALADVELSAVMDEAVALVARSLEVEYSKVLELLPDGNALLLRAGVGWHEGLVERATVGAATDSQAGYTLLSSQPVIVEDLRTETRFAGPPLLHDHGVVSGISVVIQGQKYPFGVLGAHTTKLRRFTQDDIHFLQAIASVLATVIERQQAETEIRFQAHLLSAVEQAVIATDLDGIITYWNRFAEKLYGWSAAEAVGRSILEITPTWFSQAQAAEILFCLRRGESWSGEFLVQHRDGTTFPALVTNSPIYDCQKVLSGIVGISTDITERQQAQLALRESEARFRQLAESIDEVFFITAADAKQIFYISPAYEKIWGRSCESLYQQPRSWLQAIHPDDSERVRAALSRQIQGEQFQEEYRIIRPDGTIHWIFDRSFPVDDEAGSILYYVGLAEDISVRKQAEQKISEQAALLDITADAILVRDFEHQILFWNQGAEQMYGWTAEEAVGKNVTELLYKQASPQLEIALQTVVERGEWQGELNQVTKSGQEIMTASRWTLMRDATGKPKSILTVATDITEKKQLEAQLLRAQRLESIGTLASGIAHELNNILTPILMTAQLLQLKFPDANKLAMEMFQIQEANAKRGAAIVKQVLSFARGVEGERKVLQLRHLLLEIRQFVKQTFPKSIELSINIPANLWTIFGDATQLHQVLMNLALNASDAMPEGGRLSICAKNFFIDENYARMNLDARVGSYIVVTVADTGTGIPPQVLERIFDPFFTTKEVGKGTGLGLATALGIVKSHAGFVKVKSQVGKGTQFQVFLPAVAAAATMPAEELKMPVGHGELILVVDDEASIRQTTQTSLELYGYKVFTACDGIEAIALYAQHKREIALVLMDLMMPSMDGLTAINILQKMNSAVKTVAVSGLLSTNKVVETAGAGVGVKVFLEKPYTARELLNTINSVLSSP